MSTHLWKVTLHIIPASHIRGFPRGVQDEQQNSQLRLSVKQYTPLTNPGHLTLLIAHGVGSAKEVYEPFLDELLAQNIPIRSAWSIDIVNHGQSYVLNEKIIGDEPHWLDPARDYLHAVNHFQSQMPPPIYGIGQSWGCVNIVMMSHIHPRLFAGMILMEPTFETGYKHQSYNQPGTLKDSESRMALLAKRRDTWPSRSDARTRLHKNPYFASYDPRVFNRMIQYGLRDRPTPTNPHAVTLTTPKAQEVYLFGRPDPPFPGYEAAPDYSHRTPATKSANGFYRGEVEPIKRALGGLRPPVLYIWGTESDIGNSAYPQRVIEQTGVGDEGSGGERTGQVQSKYVEGGDHLIPFKMPVKAAAIIAGWLRGEVERWEEEARRRRTEQPPFEPGVLNALWMERISKL
ncbi:hypothetical protein ACLMJK_003179 [Lecanora helva]